MTKSKSIKIPAITAEEKHKERIRQKKKAPKHDPSAEKVEPDYKFFNETDHKNIRENLARELNVMADKYNVEHIDLEISPPYPSNFFARDWSWRAEFFINNLKQYEDTLDYPFVDHYRWWLDRVVDKCSVMIWNLVLGTLKEEYKKTGVVPKSPLSKKKGRDSIEAVAEYYANKESEEFGEKFK